MSKSNSNRLIAAVASLGIAGLLTAGAVRTDAAVYPITVNHTPNNTGSGVYSTDGVHGAANGNTWPAVGHTASGLVFRYIMTFKLPVLSTGGAVQNATFDTSLSSINGTPTGNALLFYFPTTSHGSVWTNDFERTPATQVTPDAAPLLTPTSTESPDPVDVTQFVKDSYTNGHAYAMFRIGIPADHDTSSTTTDRYNFGNSTLTLTTVVPEPAGLGALALGGLMLIRRRKTRFGTM